jgi:hypothetical protein
MHTPFKRVNPVTQVLSHFGALPFGTLQDVFTTQGVEGSTLTASLGQADEFMSGTPVHTAADGTQAPFTGAEPDGHAHCPLTIDAPVGHLASHLADVQESTDCHEAGPVRPVSSPVHITAGLAG